MSLAKTLDLTKHGFDLFPSEDSSGHFVWRRKNSTEYSAVVYLWNYEENNCAVDIWLECHNKEYYNICKRYLVESQEQLDFLATSNIRIYAT